MSDYISTSRNTDKIIAKAIKENPGQPILITPDKYLGDVMKIRALELLEQEGIVIDEDLIQVYRNKFNGFQIFNGGNLRKKKINIFPYFLRLRKMNKKQAYRQA